MRGARRRVQGRAARLARASGASSRSTRTSRSRPARAGWSRPHSEEEWRLLALAAQPGPRRDVGWLQHGRLGFNYRLDDISAALGIGQLEKLDEDPGAARRASPQRYEELLARRRRRRDALRRRRRPRPLVVRLRRASFPTASTRERRDRALSSARGSAPAATCRRSTCSRTCASATASARGCARSSEDASARTMALPFFTALERDDQERVVEALATALR